MKKEYLKIVGKLLYFAAILIPAIFLLEAYQMYQYKDLGFMIVLQSPNGTYTPLFQPWMLFVAIAIIWTKAAIMTYIAGIALEED